jgi:hypothetical protein
MRRAQHGHALTEFIAVAAVLVPLLLLVPVIGKYQDIRHAVQMGSRTAAFDATLHNDQGAGWKPLDTLADEIRLRHFAAPDAFVRSGAAPTDAPVHGPAHWTDPHGNPLIRRQADIRVGFGAAASDDRAAGFSAASDGTLFNLNPFASAGSLGLGTRGVFTADVSVPLANLPAGVRAWEPFDRIDLTMRAHTSVLIDGWTARSPAQVEQRVAGLAPLTGGLAQAGVTLMSLPIELLELGRLQAPRIGQLEVWRDVVPADRLVGPNRERGAPAPAPAPAEPPPSPSDLP